MFQNVCKCRYVVVERANTRVVCGIIQRLYNVMEIEFVGVFILLEEESIRCDEGGSSGGSGRGYRELGMGYGRLRIGRNGGAGVFEWDRGALCSCDFKDLGHTQS